MSATIYHNPKCGTSRNVLSILHACGAEPEVIEYLKTGWTTKQLKAFFLAAGISPRDALRISNIPDEEPELLEPSVSDEAIIAAMVKHPILVNRPIVQTRKGTALCRPLERVFTLLDVEPGTQFTKENGDCVSAPLWRQELT
jgi:arsenate reductase (glutaredoxin)